MRGLAAILVVGFAAVAQAQPAGSIFSDCQDCPEMVLVPAGRAVLGSPEAERLAEQVPADYAAREVPQTEINLPRAFAVGRYEVTRKQYGRFIAQSNYMPSPGCAVWDFAKAKFAEDPNASWQNPGFPQKESEPVVCVSFDDAMAYVAWLSRLSGQPYRLLSEAEWEYVARAGTVTARPWGDERDAACRHASIFDLAAATKVGMVGGSNDQFDCDDGYIYTAPVGAFPANAFGVFDMLGNASEWVMDCYNPTLEGLPVDGAPRLTGNCDQRITRGGAWSGKPWIVRSAERGRANAVGRNSPLGFRVARDLK